MTAPLLKELIVAPHELDYVYLTSIFQNQASPQGKIKYLIKRGDIVRVKKGLYVLSRDYGKPFSKFVLSNMIYGPSYVTAESALSYYGLIPERVEAVTAVCIQKKKTFETPVGTFIYYFSALRHYPFGLRREMVDDKRAFLIASPEKALYDLLRYRKGVTEKDSIIETIEHLRLSEDSLHCLNRQGLEELKRKGSRRKIAEAISEYITLRRT